jgi:anaerobic magnesium-protoporphyrin IX monomethyl ester cyclase
MRVGIVGAEIEENLAMRSIAASLVAAGHEARIFDFHARDQLDRVADAVAQWSPELLGMSMIFTVRAEEFMDLGRAMRVRGWAGHLTAGGHFAALHAPEILRDCEAMDSIVHGEGEEPMVEMARDLVALGGVPGLTVREADGTLRHTGPRPNLEDLDARAPSIRPAKFHEYLGRPIASLLASRGCWADCAFCSINAFHRQCGGGKRYRQRRIEHVVAEMAHLYHDLGARIFNFQDDNFFVPSRAANLERFAALRDGLRAARVGRIAMQVKARPDCIHEDVVDMLLEVGLFRFFLGVETDAVVGLRTLGRGIDREQNHRALAILRKREIHTCFNLLTFDPESTLEAIAQNVDFMRKQSFFPLNFCRVEVYAGTAIEERLRREGRLIGDYRGYSYAIRDLRAQRAYELFRPVFWPRNFGPNGMHHESMKVDYEYHVLRHFQPGRACRRLEKRVKGLVQEVNANSAELMDRVLAFAASPRWDAPAAVAAEVAALQASREAADASLGPRIRQTVRHIEQLASGEALRRPSFRAAAASAAALMAAAGCPRQVDDTHMCEMAPPPYETVATGTATAMPPEEAAALTSELNDLVAQELWSWFQTAQLANVDVAINLVVTSDGGVARCGVAPVGDEAFRSNICGALLNRRFGSVRAGGAVQVHVTWDGSAGSTGYYTHMCEMVPYEPYTHMCEMAPPPYETPYVPPPPPPPPPDGRPAPFNDQDVSLLQASVDAAVSSQLWELFQSEGLQNVAIPVGLTIQADGLVEECNVAPVVSETVRDRLCEVIAGLTFYGIGRYAAGQVSVKWDGSVPATLVPDDDWQTHMCEAAPPPYDPADTDPNRAWKRTRKP